jgi:uncharacterized protein (TIGR03083 family)
VTDCTGAQADLAGLYRDTRLRLTELLAGLDSAALAMPVPACPGWAVRDVAAHLTAVAEDAVAGRLAGIPAPEFTADQVIRLAGADVAEMLSRWADAAGTFEPVLDAFEVWPAVIDVASHEQDIRSAVGHPGARDCLAIRACTPWLLTWLRPSVPLLVVTEDAEYMTGGEQAELIVSTSRFEAFRWRMGRRSKAQLAAMTWSGDPSAVLGELTVFGPTAQDVVE